jgi:hypothetical protein
VQLQDEDSEGGAPDECQLLIRYLLAEHPHLESIRGKLLRTTIASAKAQVVRWPGLEMSPYTITIGER